MVVISMMESWKMMNLGCELCDLQFPSGSFDSVLIVYDRKSGRYKVWSSEWHATQKDSESRVLASLLPEMLTDDQRIIGQCNVQLLDL